jgi:hypothetical protein
MKIVENWFSELKKVLSKLNHLFANPIWTKFENKTTRLQNPFKLGCKRVILFGMILEVDSLVCKPRSNELWKRAPRVTNAIYTKKESAMCKITTCPHLFIL